MVQEKVAGLRRFGSAALDLAWVAAGRLDGYWERNLVALGHGGRAAASCARPAALSPICDDDDAMFATGDIIAGNETMHRDLLALLKRQSRLNESQLRQAPVGVGVTFGLRCAIFGG